MILFTDNQTDIATVSSEGSSINYPASNVQDSRLDRIFRGGEQVDFDISGAGGLQNISQSYTNLLQDPTDLTTGNWTLSNGATAVSSSETYQGLSMSKIGSTTAITNPNITQSVTVTASVDHNQSIVIRNGNHTNSSADDTLLLAFEGATERGRATIRWVDKTVGFSSGVSGQYTWNDNDTLVINMIPNTFTSGTSFTYRIDPIVTEDPNKYIYITACQVVDNTTTFFPFISGSKSADEIEETFTMPDRFTFDMIVTPNFAYDYDVNRFFWSWRIDGANRLDLIYNQTQDKFVVEWEESYNYASMISDSFDDGSSFTNINQRLRFIGSLDLSSGGQNDSRFIVVPLESGSKFEDITWSTTPAIKSKTFTPLHVGYRGDGGTQADSSYEYLRIYEGLLVGTVEDSDDVTELLKDKKVLFDATYKQNLTATDLLIANNTINDGDTITLRANDVDSYGEGSPLDETVTWSKDIITHTFLKSTYQYWRISINSSNVIDMGRIYLGESYEPPGISPSVTNSLIDNSIKTVVPVGVTYGDERYKNELVSVSFPVLTHEEKAEIFDIFREIGYITPFFVTFEEECLDLDTLYVTMDNNTLDATLLDNPAYYRLSLQYREEV